MNDKRISKGLLWLGFLLSLLILLLSNALSWLDDSDYNWLLSAIPYKWQLTILMMIILSLVFALLYTKTFYFFSIYKNVNDSKGELKVELNNEPENNKNILENLSPNEKVVLKIFVEQKSKVINLEYNSTVKILCRNRILRCLNIVNSLSTRQEIMIEEWAWDWINKNKEKLL